MHSTIYVYPGSDSNPSLDTSQSDARTATLNSVIRGAMTDTEHVFGVEYRDNLKQAVEYFAAVIESRFPHLPPWMDAYERIEQHRAKIDELTEQLATREAQATAIREAIGDLVEEFRKLEATEGNEPIRCSRMHFGNWADKLLKSLPQPPSD
jgi:chromosome segregation ATPase